MNIVVHRDRCISAGMCTLTAPMMFDQDEDDGRVMVVGEQETDSKDVIAVRRAAAVCPSQAIELPAD